MSIVSSSPILTFLSDFFFFGLTSHSYLHMRGATTSEQTNESLPFISMDLFYKKRGNRTTGRRQGDVTRRFIPPQQTNKQTNKQKQKTEVRVWIRPRRFCEEKTKLWDEPIRTEPKFPCLPLPD